jgi:hypothetical protein
MGMNQTAAAIAVATSIALPGVPRIGTPWKGQGGLNGGMFPGENGAPDYFLIGVDSPLAKHKGIAYGGYRTRTPGADSKFDGLANTEALLASGNDHPLAKWAAGLSVDGFSDLYAPSIMELAQLRVSCPGLFVNDWYLSSTQFSADGAWGQYFDGGNQYGAYKTIEARGVAVRRLIIQPFSPSAFPSSVAA